MTIERVNLYRFLEGYGIKVRPYRESRTPRLANVVYGGRTVRRARCSRERVSQMEQSFSWVLAYVLDEEHRKALLAYTEIKARRWQWERYLENRNRRNPSKKHG